jgi:hypothetical protein
MSLHPIKALNQVIDEYKDFLLTEFRAKDPKLKESLEREIEKPGFLAQEPFFQAHRPFKEGKKWQDLSIDKKLAKVMESKSKSQYCYLHQSQSIDNLLSDTATPIVITTGTGSGKTECFLLPVIQNAIDDSIAFKRSGLTAILLYPMNALANDQLERIDDYLKGASFSGNVKVAKYDRGTTQAERELLRKNPPHILLTNYMMLEYLLVRPADREAIFTNHRCRFFVLDEVHTYRGALGSNIALLVRRVKAHLKYALQDWGTDQAENLGRKRFPELITIGTSATIKSEIEEGLSKEELIKRRDNDIQEFFSKLTGVQKETIQVIGEELQDVSIPTQARYAESPADIKDLDFTNREFLIKALCILSGTSETTDMNTAANSCRLIWDLNAWLIKKPMSLSQIVDKVSETIPERKSFSREIVQKEIEMALLAGGYP